MSRQVETPGVTRLAPPPPNQLKALSVHFSQLLPGLIILNITVVVGMLTTTIPAIYEFWGLNNKHVIASISIISAFLFYIGTKKSYFAQSNNIAELEPEARKFLFDGVDPFEHLKDFWWREMIKAYMDEANLNLNRAEYYLEAGIILLFISVSHLFLSYNYILGGISSALTILYIITTLNGYSQLRRELRYTGQPTA